MPTEPHGGEALRHPEYAGAHAMAIRQRQENVRQRDLLQTYASIPLPAVPDSLHQAVIDSDTTYLLGLLEGSPDQDPVTRMILMFQDMDGEKILDCFGLTDQSIDPEEVRAFAVKTFQIAQGFFDLSSLYYDKPLDVYNAAKEVATEEGIPTAEIFMSNDYYGEVIRRTQTPAGLVQAALGPLENFTPQAMANLILENILAAERLAAAIHGSSPRSMQSTQEVLSLGEDPEFLDEMKGRLDTFLAAAARLCLHEIKHFWGQDGLEALPDEIRQKLGNLLLPPVETGRG